MFQSSLILVKNIKASRKFYETIHKQQVEYDFGESVSFRCGFATFEQIVHEINF
ncbi:MAG: hypothetical protein ACUVXA_04170 [Candidatus Jordarchaeum sp.]|uniref:hypothetical protein n=1 Tax=Candidatus Jordarchaeum sp. TaxID=2823881 RepID=UPI00404AB3BF